MFITEFIYLLSVFPVCIAIIAFAKYIHMNDVLTEQKKEFDEIRVFKDYQLFLMTKEQFTQKSPYYFPLYNWNISIFSNKKP
jgi:hypothetical protein